MGGTCTDRAGNVAALSVPLRYDATPPALTVSATPGDGVVNLRWDARAVAPITSVEIARTHGASASVMHRGNPGSLHDSGVRNWTRYEYTVRATDEAGNVRVRKVVVTPGPRLLGPKNGTRMTTPPMLRWTPVRNATYYNVQLYDGGKVLSVWPRQARLRLTSRWRFVGRRHHLKPGRYRWFVWPGYGPRSAARYGHLVGKGTFVIASAKAGATAALAAAVRPRVAPDANR